MAKLASYRPLEPETSRAVAADGLPRVARFVEVFDDGALGAEVLHVLYMDPAIPLPRSMLATEWVGPLPTEPTAQESAAAIVARETERGAKKAAALLKRQGMLALAQSAVGVKVGTLTPRQVEALLGVALLGLGALDDDLKIRPLEAWDEQ